MPTHRKISRRTWLKGMAVFSTAAGMPLMPASTAAQAKASKATVHYQDQPNGMRMWPYRILGACNPKLAYRALQLEDKIGTMLPCNVIVQEHQGGSVEVSAVDPVASMQAIDNPGLAEVAKEVQARLKRVVEGL